MSKWEERVAINIQRYNIREREAFSRQTACPFKQVQVYRMQDINEWLTI